MKSYLNCQCSRYKTITDLNLKNQTITYTCKKCQEPETLTFKEAQYLEDSTAYFTVNMDGEALWHCDEEGPQKIILVTEYGLDNKVLESLYKTTCSQCGYKAGDAHCEMCAGTFWSYEGIVYGSEFGENENQYEICSLACLVELIGDITTAAREDENPELYLEEYGVTDLIEEFNACVNFFVEGHDIEELETALLRARAIGADIEITTSIITAIESLKKIEN